MNYNAMAKKLAEQVEDMGIAFIYAVVLIGSVGFAFYSSINLTAKPVYNETTGAIIGYTSTLDTTQLLAWGLVLTFLVLGIAFGFMGYMRSKTGKR